MNYLTFSLPPKCSAGLNHHLGNLYCFLNLAYHKKKTLISPFVMLDKKHNPPVHLLSDLSKYFQFDSVVVEGNPFPIIPNMNLKDLKDIEVVDINQESYDLCGGALSNSDMFSSVPDYPRYIPTKNHLKKIAKNFAEIISDKYTCIHVRRGDRVFNFKTGEVRDEELDYATSAENILKFAKLCGNKKVYIMTDESPNFFSSLRDSDFDFFFCEDFDILNFKDNFLLYQIENEIMQLADKKISTFSVDMFKGFYDFSLLDRKGWS